MSRKYKFRDGKACYKTREAPYVERITELSESACIYLLLKYICRYHDHYLGMHQKKALDIVYICLKTNLCRELMLYSLK